MTGQTAFAIGFAQRGVVIQNTKRDFPLFKVE